MHGLVRISPSNRGLIWQTGFNAILNAGMDPEVKIIYWMDLKQATHFVCCIQTSYLHFSTENVQFKGNYRNQISIAWNWKWTDSVQLNSDINLEVWENMPNDVLNRKLSTRCSNFTLIWWMITMIWPIS